MAFKSMAYTRDGVMADFADYLGRSLNTKGMVPPSLGVTRPVSSAPITNSNELFDAMGGWFREQRQRQGGAAFDMKDSPVDETYRARRFDFLSREEGIRHRAYDDATGRPVEAAKVQGLVTVGVGFNMDRPDARNVWHKVFGDSVDFDAVKAGRKALDDVQVRALFDETANEAESFVANRFNGVDLTEHQRLALVSLAFNNPSLVGPKLTAAVKAGDTKTALFEILHNSNAKKVRGLGSRRYHEASAFVGPLEAQAALPSYQDYMAQFA